MWPMFHKISEIPPIIRLLNRTDLFFHSYFNCCNVSLKAHYVWRHCIFGVKYFYWENDFFLPWECPLIKLIPLVQVYHIKHTLWWIDNSFQSQIIIILLPFCKKETSSEKRKALWYFWKIGLFLAHLGFLDEYGYLDGL